MYYFAILMFVLLAVTKIFLGEFLCLTNFLEDLRVVM